MEKNAQQQKKNCAHQCSTVGGNENFLMFHIFSRFHGMCDGAEMPMQHFSHFYSRLVCRHHRILAHIISEWVCTRSTSQSGAHSCDFVNASIMNSLTHVCHIIQSADRVRGRNVRPNEKVWKLFKTLKDRRQSCFTHFNCLRVFIWQRV